MKEEGGKNFTGSTAKNCGFNCFMGSRQKIKASQSESFWPKFRQRLKQDGKSMTFKISPAENETGKSESFLLSVSGGGELIPVKIVSPVGNEEISTQKIPVKKRTKEENAQKISVKKRAKEGKTERRSWVRIAVGAFCFSTKKSLKGKVIQLPGDSGIVAVQPANAPADSNDRPLQKVKPSEVLNSSLRPVEKPSEAGNAVAVCNQTARAIDRVQGHVSEPCSPLKGSSSNSSVPRDDVSLLRHTPPRPIKIHRLATTAFDSEVALQISHNNKLQGCEAALGFSVLVIVLFCLAISDKLFAIVCTSIWFYAIPKLRNSGKAEQEPLKIPEAKKLLTKSLSNSNIDLQSSEYRKRIIMEGLLQRNHKPA